MAYRDYIVPKIPSEWRGSERTYANMLQNVLDDLHMPVKEEWLSDALRDKLQAIADEGGSAKQSYSEETQDTGLYWIDGSPIKRVTQVFNVPANVVTDSNTIENLLALIRVEGYVLTGAGACYPVGHAASSGEVNVWKTANSNVFKVLSTVGGTAYITVWYIEGEAPVTEDTFIFFNDGYTEYAGGGQIAWGANQLPRPGNMTQGFPANGKATLDRVATHGVLQMWSDIGTGTHFNCNSHVCTAQLVHIPASASKLTVSAQRGPNGAYMSIALLPENAVNSMSTDNGGKISTFFSVLTTPKDFSLDLDSSMLGSDDYRIVINFRGNDDAYRWLQVRKVLFE